MGDRQEDTVMNLDLNLGPLPPASQPIEAGLDQEYGLVEELEEILDRRIIDQSIREDVWRNRERQLAHAYPWYATSGIDLEQLPDHADEVVLEGESDLANSRYGPSLGEVHNNRSTRWRWHNPARMPSVARVAAAISMTDSEDTGGQAMANVDGAILQIGEGSGAGEQRNDNDTEKVDEANVDVLEDVTGDKKEDVQKDSNNDRGFFDCNICLDLARDPIVTCCGHLFCWPCIYRWLHIHSQAKECPVCKGEVTVKNVTPIYGRGNNSSREVEEDLGIKIPVRPPARRVESLRQAIQRSASDFPIEEMIRRLGNRLDQTQDILQPSHLLGVSQGTLERGESLLNRILTSQGMRRERNLDASPNNVVDLIHGPAASPQTMEHRRRTSLIFRRAYSQIGASAPVHSIVRSGERLGELYSRPPTPARVRSQVQPPSVDDRDSFLSIAAIIHGGSQTADTAVEIDSRVSNATSSSRRRGEPSRVSDMDSGNSRGPRRRRVN